MNVKPYIDIARPDHWFKNVFMMPGIILVLFFQMKGAEQLADVSINWLTVVLGIISTCLVASSNYVINEILDAPFDALHPVKKDRPVPSGQVHIPTGYAFWLGLMVLGVGLGFVISVPFGLCSLFLWVMGLLYNIPPIRLKDKPYADVISESVNNPIRLALGWYAALGWHPVANPMLSVLVAYWMFGAFLMAVKRFAEYRMINDAERAANYRSSFKWYNEERLIESLFFYGAFFGMMSGVFIAHYRIQLVLATPLVALCIAYYIHIGFKPDSPVQNPEHLYREKKLMVLVLLSFVVCTGLLLFDIPGFDEFFKPKIVIP